MHCHRTIVSAGLTLLIASLALTSASPARAGCCRVVKVDELTPSTVLKVCEPDASGECGGLLFSGPLALGEWQEVCTESPTLVYAEWDPLIDAFGPPVEARCEGADVEI